MRQYLKNIAWKSTPTILVSYNFPPLKHFSASHKKICECQSLKPPTVRLAAASGSAAFKAVNCKARQRFVLCHIRGLRSGQYDIVDAGTSRRKRGPIYMFNNPSGPPPCCVG